MGKEQHPLLMQEMPLFFNRSFMLVRKLSGCYCSAGSQQIPQRCDAAALYPCNGHIIFLGCLDSTLHHLVGNGLSKQDHQIRRADLLFDWTGFFRKHLGIVAMGCTNVCILTAHSLVSPIITTLIVIHLSVVATSCPFRSGRTSCISGMSSKQQPGINRKSDPGAMPDHFVSLD